MENENENLTIKFIERKKKLPLLDKIKNDLNIFLIKTNYENSNILFKSLYDKHYRPYLYNYINNSDINVPNKTRTFISFNKDRFHYDSILKNEDVIDKNKDEEFFIDNLYLINSHKIFKYTLLNKYTTFFFSVSLFGSTIFQKKLLCVVSGVGLACNLALYSKLNVDKSDLLQYRENNLIHYENRTIFNIYRTLYNE